MVGFTYRRLPAIALARQLVADGRLGEIRHVRGQYLQDWISDRDAPLTWRLQKERAGSGALGDIGAHIIDLAQHVTGDLIGSVAGMTHTFITERPLSTESSGLSGRTGSDRGQVNVDDAASFLARFHGGALGVFEATRMATGRKNTIRLEINGDRGSLAFDFEDMNVLHLYDAIEEPTTSGFRRILVTEPTHPFLAGWWPPGHLLGYDHAFVHQAADLVRAIAEGQDPWPSFAEGLGVQRVLQAVEDSAAKQSWVDIAP